MIKILKYGEIENKDIFARVEPTANVTDIVSIAKACEDAGYEIISSEVEYVPQNQIALSKEAAITTNKLIVALEDLDDVQNVYTSADLSALDE